MYMTNEKKELRARCLKEREALPEGYRKIASRAVLSHVLTLMPQQAVVAGYNTIRGELDISMLMKILTERGHTLCLPVVSSTKGEGALVFRRWQFGELLVEDIYKVKIPAQSALAVTPEVLLVPLVAFDTKGHRLGYGAGYYDRTIQALRQQNPGLKAIGIAYSRQQVEAIPADGHDQKLDVIVTEKGVIQAA